MARITEELVRRRAEHNEGLISTLEELSLHQQDLVKIEHLDRWCKHLKILYLQNNLIGRIENVGRLKELQYLNLALNNVEKIENLEGCEFLQKLDFTVNFIGDLLSVETLKNHAHLEELFLTGNPCTEFEGYREFIVATLPKLQRLDGTDVSKSERIEATQKLSTIRTLIIQQQAEYMDKRAAEKAFAEKEVNKGKPGFNKRWYTDAQAHLQEEKKDVEEEEEAYTPEYRMKSHMEMAEKRKQQAKEPENKLEMPKRIRRLEKNGKMLNVNEGKYEFFLHDEGDHYQLEVQCPRYLDTSLIDCDVHPTYVRLSIKEKILQLVFQEEVSPDSGTAQRSQTTGHLLLTLPKVTPTHIIKTKETHPPKPVCVQQTSHPQVNPHQQLNGHNHVHTPTVCATKHILTHTQEKFVDDPDVPPLI